MLKGMSDTSTFTDLVHALQHLTADELRARIDDLESRAAGLKRLLISVAARERAAARKAKLRAERQEACREEGGPPDAA
jgi:hypothetical protein